MIFSRTRKGSSKQGRGSGKISGEPTSGLGSIVEMGLLNKRQNKIVEGRHDFAHIAGGHMGYVFFHSDIYRLRRKQHCSRKVISSITIH